MNKESTLTVTYLKKFLKPETSEATINATNPLDKKKDTQKASQSLCKVMSKKPPITVPKNTLTYFKRDGSRQCDETPGMAPQKMKKILTSLGIPVLKAAKAYFTMGRKPALCGEPTHNINIFYLPNTLKNAQINTLLKKGFKSCIK